MLTQVIVQSSTPMTLKVEDIDPDEILILKSITGLSPEGITLFMGDFARDGGYYQGRRVGKRNVVMGLKLNPNYTTDIEISDIRELLYKTFLEPLQGSDAVQVTLDDDRKPDRYFIGYCEAINTEMWSKEQTAFVTLVCPDPYLRSAALTSASDAAGWISTPVTYDGSAETGLIAQLKVVTATPSLYLELVSGAVTQQMRLDSTPNFAVNDIIDINTTQGQRSIKQNGADIMAKLNTTSTWMKLNEASNTLRTHGGVVADGKSKIMSYSFRSAWWGV